MGSPDRLSRSAPLSRPAQPPTSSIQFQAQWVSVARKVTQITMISRLSFLLLAAVLSLVKMSHGADLRIVLGTANPRGADKFGAAVAIVKSDGNVEIEQDLFGSKLSEFDGIGWIDTSYEGKRIMIVRSGGAEPGGKTGFQYVFDTDRNKIVKECPPIVGPTGMGPVNTFLVQGVDYGMLRVIEYYEPGQGGRLRGFSLEPGLSCTDSTIPLDDTAVRGYVSDGDAGVGDVGARNRLLLDYDGQGHFEHRVNKGGGVRFPGNIPAPLLDGFIPNQLGTLSLRTELHEVLTFSTKAHEKYRYLVHNLKDDSWKVLPLESNEHASLRSLGPWICWQETVRLTRQQAADPRSVAALEKLGSEEWRPEASRWGKAARDAFSDGMRFSGVLHVYNSQTSQHAVIQTKQGDSETLLVEGSAVYYRSSDRLYSVEVTGSNVGRPRLVAQSPLIRDAHWAFRPR